MIEFGIVTEDEPVELIEGEILRKMPVGIRHAATVKRINRLLIAQIADRAVIGIQDPVVFPESEPEPDISVLRPRDDFYASRKPFFADVLLLIEVADTSLEFDREIKLAMYARAGIQDYWIVNLVDSCLEVFRDPRPEGDYGSADLLKAEQSVAPLAFSGLSVSVSELIEA